MSADILARTLYGEARGEPPMGKVAVASVILNRVAANSWYGGTVEEVCLKPFQFSTWNKNDPNLPKIKAVTESDPVFAECLFVAKYALAGLFEDPTNGATHYHASGVTPNWAEGKAPVIEIGRHAFYRGVK